jgi:hypothetical protein
MQDIEKFLTLSSIHTVKESDSGFSIEPAEESEVALARFQKLAKEATGFVSNEYSVKPHFSDGMIDLVFFHQEK